MKFFTPSRQFLFSQKELYFSKNKGQHSVSLRVGEEKKVHGNFLPQKVLKRFHWYLCYKSTVPGNHNVTEYLAFHQLFQKRVSRLGQQFEDLQLLMHHVFEVLGENKALPKLFFFRLWVVQVIQLFSLLSNWKLKSELGK